jgi:hypothetical protein
MGVARVLQVQSVRMTRRRSSKEHDLALLHRFDVRLRSSAGERQTGACTLSLLCLKASTARLRVTAAISISTPGFRKVSSPR